MLTLQHAQDYNLRMKPEDFCRIQAKSDKRLQLSAPLPTIIQQVGHTPPSNTSKHDCGGNGGGISLCNNRHRRTIRNHTDVPSKAALSDLR